MSRGRRSTPWTSCARSATGCTGSANRTAPGYWLVTRHADVRAVLRDASVFSSWLGATQVRDPATPQDLAYVRRMMLNMDPPEHTRLRQPMVRSFTMRAVAQLESRIGGARRPGSWNAASNRWSSGPWSARPATIRGLSGQIGC
jgi:cytochrome P450